MTRPAVITSNVTASAITDQAGDNQESGSLASLVLPENAASSVCLSLSIPRSLQRVLTSY
jgi:hypothetical protein